MDENSASCYIDMEFLNPGIWLYNFTIDLMLKKGKELKPQSIIRIMTGYLNLQKPKIPISYIPKSQIYRIIKNKKKLRKYTNLEALCKAEYPNVHVLELERIIRGNAKYTMKRLTDENFRKGFLFESLMITARGLYENINTIKFRMDEFLADEKRIADMLAENNIIMQPNEGLEQHPTNENSNIENFRRNNNSITEPIQDTRLQVQSSIEESAKSKITSDSEVPTSPPCEEAANLENFNQYLSEIYINCKSFDDFVQYTNVRELAATRVSNLNIELINPEIERQLTEIILQNTWRQVQSCYIFDTNNRGILTNSVEIQVPHTSLGQTSIMQSKHAPVSPEMLMANHHHSRNEDIEKDEDAHMRTGALSMCNEGVEKCQSEDITEVVDQLLAADVQESFIEPQASRSVCRSPSTSKDNELLEKDEELHLLTGESSTSINEQIETLQSGHMCEVSEVVEHSLVADTRESFLETQHSRTVQTSPHFCKDIVNIESMKNLGKRVESNMGTIETLVSPKNPIEILQAADKLTGLVEQELQRTDLIIIDDNLEKHDLDATQLNLELEQVIKTEPHSQYSSYSEDIEIIPNVSEIIEVQDSMTVSQLLATQEEQVDNRNQCYDLVEEPQLNNSTNDGLLQRIDAVLEPQTCSVDSRVSQHLELSYELIKFPNNTAPKRGRRKRKATRENQNDITSNSKIKVLDVSN